MKQMKNLKNKNLTKIFALIVISTSLFLVSCYSPNPLYGKWGDSKGNSISFNPDLTYNATIYDNTLTKGMYEGTYNIIENVMVITNSAGNSFNTEWDLRGSILNLVWVSENGGQVNLKLYHISK